MTKKIRCGVLAALLFSFCLAFGGAGVLAQGRQPQLMDGKKTLFKRAIVRPGALLYPAASDQSGAPVAAFSVFYVYGQSGDFVEVGKTIGAAAGFVKADKVIEWKQTIVAVFNKSTRANRERTLLFQGADSLDAAVGDANPREKLTRLRADAAAGRAGDGSVVAIEPENPPDIRQNFYFFPILSVANKRLQRIDSKVLRVASLSKFEPPPPPADRKRELADMRVAVVFVIDTTTSMGPYIDKVREAMTRAEERLNRTKAGANMRFGLIGFRQSLADNTPGVEYHVKTFLKLGKASTAEAFVKEISNVKESPAPTKGFNEDSLGGVFEALSTTDWRDFDAKFIVMVTDAGPLLPESGRTLRAPGLGPEQIQRKAQEEGVAISVVHLLTAEGASDHTFARNQYLTLSRTGEGSAYFAVPDGALDKFTRGIDDMADAILNRVQAVAAGDTQRPVPTGNPIRDAIERNFYAMQLAYLGRREGSRAPDMFEAYMADRDLLEPTKETVEIRLFLTKNQLATMHDVTQRIIEAGVNSTADATKFFTQLRQAIATMARDPNRRVDTQFDTLGSALGEFLEGLPYAQASPVLAMDERAWIQLGYNRWLEMRNDLSRKLRFFEDWHNTPENWVSLSPGVPEGEKVTAFPLSQLP